MKAIHYVSNNFYARCLDQRMVYSCAYFESAQEDLPWPARAKSTASAVNSDLRPDERLLDIGSGWGGPLIHPPHRYGVDVLGITLNRDQADLANERIARTDLHSRCSLL